MTHRKAQRSGTDLPYHLWAESDETSRDSGIAGMHYYNLYDENPPDSLADEATGEPYRNTDGPTEVGELMALGGYVVGEASVGYSDGTDTSEFELPFNSYDDTDGAYLEANEY